MTQESNKGPKGGLTNIIGIFMATIGIISFFLTDIPIPGNPDIWPEVFRNDSPGNNWSFLAKLVLCLILLVICILIFYASIRQKITKTSKLIIDGIKKVAKRNRALIQEVIVKLDQGFNNLNSTFTNGQAATHETLQTIEKRLNKIDTHLNRINDELDEIRKDLYAPSEFRSLFSYDSSTTAKYYITFTNKTFGRKKTRQGPSGDNEVGNNESYVVPQYPYDEYELITLIKQRLNLPRNSIIARNSRDYLVGTSRNEITSCSFSIIGSPKGNEFSTALFKNLEKLVLPGNKIPPISMKIENNECFIEYARHRLIPTSTIHPDPESMYKENPYKLYTDYALIMRLPNLFQKDKNHSILFFAGCKVAGQVAITQWVSDPINLKRLNNKFKDGTYFLKIFKVEYHYQPRALPLIGNINEQIALGEAKELITTEEKIVITRF